MADTDAAPKVTTTNDNIRVLVHQIANDFSQMPYGAGCHFVTDNLRPRAGDPESRRVPEIIDLAKVLDDIHENLFRLSAILGGVSARSTVTENELTGLRLDLAGSGRVMRQAMGVAQ